MARVEDKIKMMYGNAEHSLKELIKNEDNLDSFDFFFIDADKVNYDKYVELALLLLKRNGWIALDNVFAMGGVDTNDEDLSQHFRNYKHIMRRLNEKLHKNKNVHYNIVNITDGLGLVIKK